MKLLNYILENAPTYLVQQAVKEFNVKAIGYKMKNSIINAFPEYRGHALQFGVDLSNEFQPFKTDEIALIEINHEIVKIQNQLKVYSKYHETYKTLVSRHDVLVMINNELNKPINEFLKLYKKSQKAKSKKISVVKKRERTFQIPA